MFITFFVLHTDAPFREQTDLKNNAMDITESEQHIAASSLLTRANEFTSAISWPLATANSSGTGNVQVRLREAETQNPLKICTGHR